ncbi:MAG: hypothetical protein QOE77_1989 [Blastocatellia bacterium]|jgi:hypothetical protein|nr:hypothetical protein [Blastocatellia bacterium]
MRKPIFYYLAGVLSVIAVLVVLWAFGLILAKAFDFGGGGSDYIVTETSPSPDGKYVATIYNVAGGGAAGWCSRRATVNPSSEPFTIEREKREGKYLVFDVSCGTEVNAKWEGDRSLLITYKNLNKDFGITVYKKPSDWDRNVAIKYIEE